MTGRAIMEKKGAPAKTNPPQSAREQLHAQIFQGKGRWAPADAKDAFKNGLDAKEISMLRGGADFRAKEPFAESKTHRASDTGRKIDTKELLKKEMFGSANAADDDHFEKSRPSPNGILGVSDHYLFLDTFAKDQAVSDPSIGLYKWNFMVQGENKEQDIGARDKIENVVEMQTAQFTMPFIPENPYVTNPLGVDSSLPILVPNPAPPVNVGTFGSLTQIPFNGRLALVVKELGRQAVPTKAGRQHFELLASLALPGGLSIDTTPAPTQPLFIVPLPGFETFVFTDPIKDVHGVTVQFLNPDKPLRLPQDCFYNVVARVDSGGTGFLEFVIENHQFVQDETILISGFTSSNKVLNDYLNSDKGRLVGDAATITADTFRLNPDVDVSAFGPAGTEIASSTGIMVCAPQRRMRIPIRFRGTVGRLTNYMAP